MKIDIDLVYVAQILIVAVFAYILAQTSSLPLYAIVGLVVALVGLVVLNSYMVRKAADYIVGLAARVLSDQINTNQTRIQREVEEVSTDRSLRPSIVAWNQVKGNKFLHPYQMEIDSANKEMVYGVYGRYPIVGEKIALSFDEIVSSKMTVGRFMIDADGTLYPIFAETSLLTKEFIKIFGNQFAAKVENYFYDTKQGTEFVLLVFNTDDPRTNYLLLRLPKDHTAKPFRYERLN